MNGAKHKMIIKIKLLVLKVLLWLHVTAILIGTPVMVQHLMETVVLHIIHGQSKKNINLDRWLDA